MPPSPNADVPSPAPHDPRHPTWWVSTTYFAEGFPYALVNNVAEVMFKELGAGLQAIGLTAIFHLPWNLKFLWAPVLDHHETKRRFMLGCEIAVIGLLAVLMLLGEDIPLWLASIAFVLLAFVAATHDVAIDGFYLEALDRDGQSRFVGLRAAAYRGAVLLASGPLLVLADLVGWRATWAAAALVMVVLLAYHWMFLPATERRREPFVRWLQALARPRVLIAIGLVLAVAVLDQSLAFVRPVVARLRDAIGTIPGVGGLGLSEWIGLLLLVAVGVAVASLGRLRRLLATHDSRYARAFLDLLEQPRMGRALALILLFRTGESFLMKMRQPFLRDTCGMDLATYGMINGTLGFAATLVATLVGGWLIAKHGLRRWLWPMVLAQNVPNLLYAALAATDDPSALGHVWVGTVVIVEDIGAGFGTAVFLVYIMRCCDPRHKATHMAVLTAIMSIGFTLAGMASGFLVEWLGGFALFFALTFVATIPSMVLLPFVPFLDPRPDAGPPRDDATRSGTG